jgi:hypothetical protein
MHVVVTADLFAVFYHENFRFEIKKKALNFLPSELSSSLYNFSAMENQIFDKIV